MALGFNTTTASSGDILPIVKWDAKAGDFIQQDRTQGADGVWVKDEKELALPISFAMDLGEIEVGWLSFASGAPDFQMVKASDGQMPAKPSEDHKQAFRVRIASRELGLREFSHSAKTVLRAMDDLHNQYEAQASANPGKVPVVTVHAAETIKINSPQGELRFKVPQWSITEWIDRPAMFDGDAAPQEPAPMQATPMATQQPPAAQPSGSNLF
jgi:hypothetical protein